MKGLLLVAGGVAAGGLLDGGQAVVVVLVLLATSGFFSGSETAVLSANRARLERQADEGSRDARKALALLRDAPNTIAAALVGTNLCNIGAASLATATLTTIAPEHGPAIATLIITPLVLVFGEILPKAMFRARPTRLLRACAGALGLFAALFRPLVALTSWATQALLFLLRVPSAERRPVFARDDLENLFLYGRVGGDAGQPAARESEAALRMAGRVLDLQRRRVAEALRPLEARRTCRAAGTLEEARARFRESGVAVLAAVDAEGKVAGFVAAKDVLGEPPGNPLGPYVRTPHVFGPDDSLDRAITDFRRHRAGLGLVRARDGRTLGVLTPEDVLEEVVGELRADVSDAEPKD